MGEIVTTRDGDTVKFRRNGLDTVYAIKELEFLGNNSIDKGIERVKKALRRERKDVVGDDKPLLKTLERLSARKALKTIAAPR